MGPVKGGVAVFPTIDTGLHDVGALDDGISTGTATAWVVGRSFIPLAACLAAIALLTPAWLRLRRCAGIHTGDGMADDSAKSAVGAPAASPSQRVDAVGTDSWEQHDLQLAPACVVAYV